MRLIIITTLISIVLIAATMAIIDLEKKSILNNKVEILVPKGFEIMSEEMMKAKYPSERRPTLIFTDKEGTINLAFNHITSKASQEQLEMYKENFVSTFKILYPSAEWKSTGIKEINGRKVAYLELITTAVDTEVYNLLFFTDVDGRLLLCTFNCVKRSQAEWTKSAHQIMNSLVIR